MVRHNDKDDFKHHHDDDKNEYQFTEDDGGHETYDHEKGGEKKHNRFAKFSPRDMLGNKRTRSLIIVIIVVIVLFIIFEIFYGSSKDESQQSQTTNSLMDASNNNNSSSQNPMVTQTRKAAVSPAVMPQTSQDNNQSQVGSLDALDNGGNSGMDESLKNGDNEQEKTAALTKAQREQIQALKSEQQASKTQLMNMRSQLSDLTDQLNTVNKNLQTVTSNLQAVRTHIRQSKTKQQAQLRQKKQYFVDAVIPGRAWLKALDGTTVTVAVGDSLPGYGKVTAINAVSGEVSTTAGDIPYGVPEG